ncbi:MAG: type 1 glutamine amidotransferase [Thioalkalivibrio sp.]|nr:MAG: type 1 glutamine amidotransferase [Thioalkalivibrio sp.]
MHFAILQHVAHEGPAALLDWGRARGHEMTIRRLYADPALPGAEDFDGLIVLGGGMGVHDGAAHPWLEPERELIRAALGSGRPVLGICLGAQQLAHALGAEVFPGAEREVGFWPIRRVGAALPLPAELPACHWHGDTFELPEGAERLASSEACTNQVFVTADGLGLGLQCHLEATPAWVDDCCTHDADYLVPGRWMQDATRLRAEQAAYPVMHRALHDLLDAFTAGVRPMQG